MDTQGEISIQMRAILVDWMVEVQVRLSLISIERKDDFLYYILVFYIEVNSIFFDFCS